MHALALRLLRHEAHRGEDLTAVLDAAERCYGKLCTVLAQLVGVSGCQALLGRALRIATLEHPRLGSARSASEPLGSIDGLRDSLRTVTPMEASDSLATVLASLMWLLATFIGDDLTLRLLRDVWPDVSLGVAGGEEESEA
jgi:hypothetical protein